MKSFEEIYQELQDITGDTSDAQLIIFKRWINDTNRIVSAKAPFLSLETTSTKDTIASQESYQIPNAIQNVRSVKITLSGGTIYIPRPVEDPRFWEYLQSLQSGDSDITRFFMKQGSQVLLWPEPATAGSEIQIRGRKKMMDMSIADYSTGTIDTATNDDETIVAAAGTTSWALGTIGNWIRIDYSNGDFQWYEIDSITDTENLELVKPYEGTTFTGQTETYKIGEFSSIPAEFHPLLYYRPLALYYQFLEKPAMANQYWRMYDGGKEAGLTHITGGMLKNMMIQELQRNEGVYVEPLQTRELSIADFAIFGINDIDIEA